jgi:hypothetical protein
MCLVKRPYPITYIGFLTAVDSPNVSITIVNLTKAWVGLNFSFLFLFNFLFLFLFLFFF